MKNPAVLELRGISRFLELIDFAVGHNGRKDLLRSIVSTLNLQ